MFNSCSVEHVPNNLEQLKIYAETSQKTTKEWYSENGKARRMENKVKNMGVIFDSRLSFEHHIKSLCSRLNGTLSYLNKVKNTLDQKSCMDTPNKCSYLISSKLL